MHLSKGYSNVAGGSLQLAQIILQANPDTKTCISSRAPNLTLDQNGCDINKQCTDYVYTSELFNETVVTQVVC